MLFQKGKLIVRHLEAKDSVLLAEWLSNPLVLEFYEGRDNPFDLEKVKMKFYNGKDDVARCIVEFDQEPIGYIQYYPLNEEERVKYGYDDEEEVIYGTDQFIGEVEYWNQGVGKILVKSMVEFLIEQNHVSRVVMDPQARNTRAIKCYEQCGLKKVKFLPENELHEGVYEDCWLMEYSTSTT